MTGEGKTVTATTNHTWIKDHIKVATNPISESLVSQGSVVNDIADFNDDGHNAACSTASNPGVSDKGVKFSSIKDARLAISIRSAKYYEDVGRTIDSNVMEWSQIKHIKSLM